MATMKYSERVGIFRGKYVEYYTIIYDRVRNRKNNFEIAAFFEF